jgi:CubicO group peptidase (beta-lactamase class C family)
MVLGHVMSIVGGQPFESLLTERVLVPAGVVDVSFDDDDDLLPGYVGDRRVAWWDHPLGGAGGMRGSVVAVAQWLRANITPPPELAKAIRLTSAVQGSAGLALGWTVSPALAELRWHNGGTGGFSSFCGFDRARGVGVVLLTNGGGVQDDLDRQALSWLRS